MIQKWFLIYKGYTFMKEGVYLYAHYQLSKWNYRKYNLTREIKYIEVSIEE